MPDEVVRLIRFRLSLVRLRGLGDDSQTRFGGDDDVIGGHRQIAAVEPRGFKGGHGAHEAKLAEKVRGVTHHEMPSYQTRVTEVWSLPSPSWRPFFPGLTAMCRWHACNTRVPFQIFLASKTQT